MKKIFEKLAPFIFIGVMLTILVVGIILFSYLLIIGAMIGFILFLVSQLREKFFSSPTVKPFQKSGRVIDHDEKHK